MGLALQTTAFCQSTQATVSIKSEGDEYIDVSRFGLAVRQLGW